MANDADDVSVEGEPSQSTPRKLGKIKSKASVDTSISRGSRDEDAHDSDGSRGGRLSKLFRRHKKSKTARGGDGTDDDGQTPGQQRGRSPYTNNRSVATLDQPSTPGDQSSQMTSDEEEEEDVRT